METQQINNVMSYFGVSCYIGTFPYNIVPFFDYGCCILNTDELGLPGVHWIAIWKNYGIANVIYIKGSHFFTRKVCFQTV